MKVLEIGCGDAPTLEAGWVHLDARPLPHVDLVQSAVDLSNLADGEFDGVVSADVIEHLSWRDVPDALGEWVRVVRPGGYVEIETPNALELVAFLVNPDPALWRWRGESDFQRFSRTLFGHQDYPENFHGCYFTRDWLAELMLAAGLSTVEDVHYSAQRFRLRGTK